MRRERRTIKTPARFDDADFYSSAIIGIRASSHLFSTPVQQSTSNQSSAASKSPKQPSPKTPTSSRQASDNFTSTTSKNTTKNELNALDADDRSITANIIDSTVDNNDSVTLITDTSSQQQLDHSPENSTMAIAKSLDTTNVESANNDINIANNVGDDTNDHLNNTVKPLFLQSSGDDDSNDSDAPESSSSESTTPDNSSDNDSSVDDLKSDEVVESTQSKPTNNDAVTDANSAGNSIGSARLHGFDTDDTLDGPNNLNSNSPPKHEDLVKDIRVNNNNNMEYKRPNNNSESQNLRPLKRPAVNRGCQIINGNNNNPIYLPKGMKTIAPISMCLPYTNTSNDHRQSRVKKTRRNLNSTRHL